MPTPPALILITNCAATKKIAAGEPVQLRNWTGSVRQRFNWWRMAVERQVSSAKARDCYGGDAWTQIIAAETASSRRTEVWVVSAGLGLLSADEYIPNYSATFVNHDLDTVASTRPEKMEWWNLLVDWRRNATGIGSITDLATENRSSILIIALSSSYLNMIIDDLIAARSALVQPDNLLIISAGTRPIPALGSSLLPIDAKFEHLVGGARATLNARMLRHIIEHTTPANLNASKVSRSLRALATGLEQPRLFERLPRTDEQILNFIGSQPKTAKPPSASSLLRLLRDQGYACEQKRFHRIYRSIDLTQPKNVREKSSKKEA